MTERTVHRVTCRKSGQLSHREVEYRDGECVQYSGAKEISRLHTASQYLISKHHAKGNSFKIYFQTKQLPH